MRNRRGLAKVREDRVGDGQVHLLGGVVVGRHTTRLDRGEQHRVPAALEHDGVVGRVGIANEQRPFSEMPQRGGFESRGPVGSDERAALARCVGLGIDPPMK